MKRDKGGVCGRRVGGRKKEESERERRGRGRSVREVVEREE